MAFVFVATAWLGACATLTPAAGGVDVRGYASFDGEAPVEPPVTHPILVAFDSARALDRRSFSPPLRHHPELRAITISAVDRRRRLRREWRG